MTSPMQKYVNSPVNLITEYKNIRQNDLLAYLTINVVSFLCAGHCAKHLVSISSFNSCSEQLYDRFIISNPPLQMIKMRHKMLSYLPKTI